MGLTISRGFEAEQYAVDRIMEVFHFMTKHQVPRLEGVSAMISLALEATNFRNAMLKHFKFVHDRDGKFPYPMESKEYNEFLKKWEDKYEVWWKLAINNLEMMSKDSEMKKRIPKLFTMENLNSTVKHFIDKKNSVYEPKIKKLKEDILEGQQNMLEYWSFYKGVL